MYPMELVELASTIQVANEKVRKMIGEIEYENQTYEERVFLQAASILTEAFEKVNKQISPYLPEYTTGYLIKQSNERFAINDTELSCGSYLELCMEGCWIAGRVEYSDKYYFYNALMRNPPLKPGMKARTIV